MRLVAGQLAYLAGAGQAPRWHDFAAVAAAAAVAAGGTVLAVAYVTVLEDTVEGEPGPVGPHTVLHELTNKPDVL